MKKTNRDDGGNKGTIAICALFIVVLVFSVCDIGLAYTGGGDGSGLDDGAGGTGGDYVTSLTIDPTNATIYAGNEQQFTAIAIVLESDGNVSVKDVSSDVIWQCTIGDITQSGGKYIFTGKKAGTGMIKAIYGTVSAEATITVNHGPTDHINITANSNELVNSSDLTKSVPIAFGLKAVDSYGNTFQIPTAYWTCSNGTIGSITQTGVLRFNDVVVNDTGEFNRSFLNLSDAVNATGWINVSGANMTTASGWIDVSSAGMTYAAGYIGISNAGMTYAAGYVNISGATIGNTVTVDVIAFTKNTTYDEGANNFTNASNLRDLINKKVGIVNAADPVGNRIDLTAETAGYVGNSITLSAGGGIAISGDKLTGGGGDTVTVDEITFTKNVTYSSTGNYFNTSADLKTLIDGKVDTVNAADPVGDRIDLTAETAGYVGNSITLSADGGITVSGDKLTGGGGDTVTVDEITFTKNVTYNSTGNYFNTSTDLKTLIDGKVGIVNAADPVGNRIDLTAETAGYVGNSITLSAGGGIAISGDKLTGGGGDTVTVDEITFTKNVTYSSTGNYFNTSADLKTLIDDATNVTASGDGNNLTLTAKAAGSTGNSITLASSNPDNITRSGDKLTGGKDGKYVMQISAYVGATTSDTINFILYANTRGTDNVTSDDVLLDPADTIYVKTVDNLMAIQTMAANDWDFGTVYPGTPTGWTKVTFKNIGTCSITIAPQAPGSGSLYQYLYFRDYGLTGDGVKIGSYSVELPISPIYDHFGRIVSFSSETKTAEMRLVPPSDITDLSTEGVVRYVVAVL